MMLVVSECAAATPGSYWPAWTMCLDTVLIPFIPLGSDWNQGLRLTLMLLLADLANTK